MTIKEFYELCVEKGAEDFDLCFFTGGAKEDDFIFSERDKVVLIDSPEYDY